MTKLSKEVPPLFGALSFLPINEARAIEQLEGPPSNTVNELVTKLSYQAPNRIYTNPDGNTCRVFLFHEDNMPYQAYIEIAKPADRMWQRVKGEYISFFTPKDLEREIVYWRSRFGMKGDLLENPSNIFMAVDGSNGYIEYLHVLEGPGQTFSCRYDSTKNWDRA